MDCFPETSCWDLITNEWKNKSSFNNYLTVVPTVSLVRTAQRNRRPCAAPLTEPGVCVCVCVDSLVCMLLLLTRWIHVVEGADVTCSSMIYCFLFISPSVSLLSPCLSCCHLEIPLRLLNFVAAFRLLDASFSSILQH